METNLNNNVENTNENEKPKGFWASGWAFLVFFAGLIVLVVAISYLIKWFI
ncbi:MAG TPA: hypothetical protein PK252_02415 [Bacteroidales bacterium]|nr:hypothetical protein [Bacteroidales bacterium]